MKPLKLAYCPAEQRPCLRWIEEIFSDCLCNIRDEISFGFGIAGLIMWAVAEIPQILTNFMNKSAAGVSLAFLSTWIIGDIFNLVGCILEPATLPTQFYTALLYTIVTVILALQCVYYNHFVIWWRFSRRGKHNVDVTEALRPKFDSGVTNPKHAPLEVPYRSDFYFISARSLVGSDTPPSHYYIRPRSGPPMLEHLTDSSEEEDDEFTPAPVARNSVSQPRPVPRPVKYGTFMAASANLPRLSKAIRWSFSEEPSGRQLLPQVSGEMNRSATGQWLGWLMAAIYMGGRIPQIWLNIKRGSVEGLNPLMFIFALIANATYVGSILVRNSEWSVIKANLPWVLDAIVCVFLDLFIIIQYVFYKYINKRRMDEEDDVAPDKIAANS